MGSEKEGNIESTDLYRNILPSIEMEIIKETRQLPQLEKPQEFIDKVTIFLEDEF